MENRLAAETQNLRLLEAKKVGLNTANGIKPLKMWKNVPGSSSDDIICINCMEIFLIMYVYQEKLYRNS